MAVRQAQHVVVENDKKMHYQKIVAETLKVFKGGDLLFAHQKSYSPHATDGDKLPESRKEMVTTAPVRLKYTEDAVVALMDYEATRDATNQKAKANLEVDGIILIKDVPVSFLIGLEKRLKEVRAYYDAIPTLDLSLPWEQAKGYQDRWMVGPLTSYREEKRTEGLVMKEATKEHPAQVKEVQRVVQIGAYSETKWSGEMQPGEKAMLLGRIDKLIEAAKSARTKANETEIEQITAGKAIFDFIHKRGKNNAG